MNTQIKLRKVALAVGASLSVGMTAPVFAEEAQEIEEVVAVGSRLQGSAAAVIEERKNQAFVADILGAEQLSRTGDSDVASALRRVTGLTLVDGKFIYVRGLGERYSSARLNGAAVPSPDLTRNVVPLDIFPSSIIESLAVQKAYSPSMPAAFGGGNIDIRTKSVPSEFVANIEVGVGQNLNSRDGFTYNRNENGIPVAVQTAVVRYRGDLSLRGIVEREGITGTETQTAADQATALNKALVLELPRDIRVKEESLDPNYDVKASIGNSFDEDWLGGTIGVLAAVSYDNDWKYSERMTAVLDQSFDESCTTKLETAEDAANSCYVTVKDSKVTTQTERMSGVFNLGYKYEQHNVSYSKIYLEDTEDESELSLAQSPNGSTVRTIAATNQAYRTYDFNYEERILDIDQVVGQHTFMDYMGIGVDWQYTESKAETKIPTNIDYDFIDNYNEDQTYQDSIVTGDDNRILYSYTEMEDNVKSYSGNLTLPVYLEDVELTFKAGYDFVDRARVYSTSSFAIHNETNIAIPVNTGSEGINDITAYLNDDFVANNDFLVGFNEPTAPSADDYIAAQKIDAGYFEFDAIFNNTWRLSGGIRYEDFKQVSIGTSSLIFDRITHSTIYSEERILAGTVNEDDFFNALSMTYLGGEKYQIRFGYGETVVRPDLRELVPVSYFDPLTDIRTFGVAGLKSSELANYDARFEYYMDNGDNFSVGAFYKDITAPIETVLQVGDEDYTATFVNGETGEVYGVEAEWLYDLTGVASGLFTSGNITLSDSEVEIDPARAGNLTNPTKRMTGHSKYVVNLQLNYDSADGQHSSSLVYNVFGERILASGIGGREDAFEQPFHSLDLVYTWYPDFNSQVKFKVQNLLDEEQEVTQSDYIVRQKEVGTSVSLSYKYEF
ncbi:MULTISPECIES: TonB-dependent receptor plug domain-containing protein [Pseudoalteromonas]|uniref:TonB-dependent receptor plug domain-containing protein n=1 Tax=Pseudoalteromonas TaxID=53246 RepID=UPI000F7AB44A|nr:MULTISPECIES: TonB-dependent receptor plug domain-containing protein [Pseudoalteromonas]MCG7559969.1 TonB-dependent receptor plug domain-containing protein [Pseudoalteromonas sp. McH1-42]MEC4089095.1 TonB-dependent receptor plug domain-containing protein [Pseudoalteromonas rubra]